MSDEPEGLDNEPEYEVKVQGEKIKVFGNTETSDYKKVEGKSNENIKLDEEKERKKESKIEPYAKGRDDFEDAVKWLSKQQYEEFEDPDNKYCTFTLPKLVTMGEDIVIKLSNKVKNVHYLFGDGYKWAKTSHYDPKSDFEIQLRPTVSYDKKDVNVNEIRIPTGSIKTINKQDYETWLTGKYLLVVRVYGKEWHEDTVIKRMVEIVEK